METKVFLKTFENSEMEEFGPPRLSTNVLDANILYLRVSKLLLWTRTHGWHSLRIMVHFESRSNDPLSGRVRVKPEYMSIFAARICDNLIIKHDFKDINRK